LELEKDVGSRCLNNDCCDSCRELIRRQRMSVSYIDHSKAESIILTNSIWNKAELPDQWNESIIVPITKKGDKTGCSNIYVRYHCYQLDAKYYPIAFAQG
jgi:hypothetical protein